MNEIRFKEFAYKNGEFVIPLGSGIDVSQVTVKLSDSDENGTITLLYALSNVLDELLFFGKQCTKNKNVFAQGTPICATHLFIRLADTAAQPEEVIVCEAEENESITYPHFFDTDLNAQYCLDSVTVKAKTNGELCYTIYTSADGQSFSLLHEKNGIPSSTGDTISCHGIEARYVRVLVTYHSATPYAPVPIVSFTGTRLEKESPKPIPVYVPDFEDTKYAKPIDKAEKIEYLYGIVERRIGERYKDWFSFDLLPEFKHDFFELTDKDGKIYVSGNCGVSVAVGLNYYLKYYCKVHLSQVGDQVKMPPSPVAVGKKIHKETKASLRFSYNACTHSYTMAFWGEDEWQRELDFLALSGVNVVLDTTAVEEIWRRFLGEIGYSHNEIKCLLSGPAYFAWQWIGNQMGQGSPLPDAWFARRTELARKNHRAMRTLGMEIVMPGYSGVVPTDIALYNSDVDIVPQGKWCSFTRPSIIRPDHPCFGRYAACYYNILEKVFGKNRYFTDALFHEGGNKADMSERTVASSMLESMLKANPDAVWFITSWQGTPSSELLAGIGELKEKHAVVMDLYGEKLPNYKNGKEGNPVHGYAPEFDGTPWILGMLSNFGGRLGLHGHLDHLVKGIPHALNNTKHCAGIGMMPEASENNPVLYDFLFDCIWQDDASKPLKEIDIRAWLVDYAERRYGVRSPLADAAWKLLSDTVYKGKYNMNGQGAPESVTNSRPSLNINAASTWGNAVIDYDKKKLAEALSLLSSIYEEAKDSAGYQYDLSALSLQVLANEAQDIHADMATAFNKGDKTAFDSLSERFLNIIKAMDTAAASSPYFRLDRWTNMAEKLAEGTDDFTKRIFLYNARAIITTWGSYHPCEVGLLHDYSNRTWAGLLGGLYYERWLKWISERKKELNGDTPASFNWFEIEWKWIWS